MKEQVLGNDVDKRSVDDAVGTSYAIEMNFRSGKCQCMGRDWKCIKGQQNSGGEDQGGRWKC
eukprot:6204380-Pleurochrysis_carterae.AAC.4